MSASRARSVAWPCHRLAFAEARLLLQSLSNVDARQIYAAAYAAANLNVATTQAPNATEIEKTSYYTQGTVGLPPLCLCCPA